MSERGWSDEVDRLAEAYHGGGGRPEGWNRLYLRTDLEDPYFEKLEAGEPAERFKETVEKVLSAGDLILYGERMSLQWR